MEHYCFGYCYLLKKGAVFIDCDYALLTEVGMSVIINVTIILGAECTFYKRYPKRKNYVSLYKS
jgi:hypothetical protein